MKFKLEIEGEPERILEHSIETMRKKIIDALARAAVDAYATARQLVPIRTGALYRSIRLERVSPFEHRIVAGHPTKTKGKPYYAPFVEYGTRKMSPRPYMRPACEKAIQTIKRMLG